MCELAEAILSSPTPTSGAGSTTSKGDDHDEGKGVVAEAPGLIIANPCQLLWYRAGGRAVSNYEWNTLPRPSAVHAAPRVDRVRNRIAGNGDYEEHVAYIFEHVIPNMVKKEAKIDLVGVEFTGMAVVEYLSEHCTVRHPSISLMSKLISVRRGYLATTLNRNCIHPTPTQTHRPPGPPRPSIPILHHLPQHTLPRVLHIQVPDRNTDCRTRGVRMQLLQWW
jgi:hypothetical protein